MLSFLCVWLLSSPFLLYRSFHFLSLLCSFHFPGLYVSLSFLLSFISCPSLQSTFIFASPSPVLSCPFASLKCSHASVLMSRCSLFSLTLLSLSFYLFASQIYPSNLDIVSSLFTVLFPPLSNSFQVYFAFCLSIPIVPVFSVRSLCSFIRFWSCSFFKSFIQSFLDVFSFLFSALFVICWDHTLCLCSIILPFFTYNITLAFFQLFHSFLVPIQISLRLPLSHPTLMLFYVSFPILPSSSVPILWCCVRMHLRVLFHPY